MSNHDDDINDELEDDFSEFDEELGFDPTAADVPPETTEPEPSSAADDKAGPEGEADEANEAKKPDEKDKANKADKASKPKKGWSTSATVAYSLAGAGLLIALAAALVPNSLINPAPPTFAPPPDQTPPAEPPRPADPDQARRKQTDRLLNAIGLPSAADIGEAAKKHVQQVASDIENIEMPDARTVIEQVEAQVKPQGKTEPDPASATDEADAFDIEVVRKRNEALESNIRLLEEKIDRLMAENAALQRSNQSLDEHVGELESLREKHKKLQAKFEDRDRRMRKSWRAWNDLKARFDRLQKESKARLARNPLPGWEVAGMSSGAVVLRHESGMTRKVALGGRIHDVVITGIDIRKPAVTTNLGNLAIAASP